MARRHLLSILFALALTGVVSASAPGHGFTRAGKVIGVVSGDTLLVRVAPGQVERVRVLGIQAPASGCFAHASRQEVGYLARGKRVTLTGARRTGAGRLAAYVRLPGGVDLGRRILAEGLAQVDIWGPGFSRFAEYVPVQQEAETNSRGLWIECASDVAVSLAVSPGRVDPGERLTYTATITDSGLLIPRNVRLDLRPPRSVRLISASSEAGACTVKSWMATCTFAEIGEPEVTATFVVETTRLGSVSTRAQVRFAGCVAQACGNSPLRDLRPEDNSTAALASAPAPPPGDELAESSCDPHYPTVCIPPPPPDLDCADIPYRNFHVPRLIPGADPHDLDGNQDGIACQKDDY